MTLVEELAVVIADRAARADIEIHAFELRADDGGRMYRITLPSRDCPNENWYDIVRDAVQYIELRGDALPFVMHRSGHGVWFVEKDNAK